MISTVNDLLSFDLEGTFAGEGFLADGYFVGSFTYRADAPDTNPTVSNVGVFSLPTFTFNIFDAEHTLVESITEANSFANIIFQDVAPRDGQSDTYILSTTQNTEINGNAFFEYGALSLTFAWEGDGVPQSAPVLPPQTFKEASYTSFNAAGWEGFLNPQQIDTATITTPPEAVLRLNAGGGEYTDTDGNLWLADQYFVGGRKYRTKAAIAGTDDDVLFRSERWLKDLAYAIPVANGEYTLNLSFAEIWANKANARVFDLAIEGETVMEDFDIYQESGGKNIALVQSFDVTVTDGELNLDFWADVNNAKLAALELLAKPAPKPDPLAFALQGQFSDNGFLANGRFEGTFAYAADAPDTNPNVTNVGVFDVPTFEINIFDANNILVDTLTGANSSASIVLQDIEDLDGDADTYVFSTTPDTEADGNAFFEYGELSFTFDWASGGDPKIVPTLAPQDLEQASYSSYKAADGWEGITNPQSIQTVAVEAIADDELLGAVVANEPLAL
ncbi:MAG: malectin [Cyanobacteria bacterium P01_F01_bin.86]